MKGYSNVVLCICTRGICYTEATRTVMYNMEYRQYFFYAFIKQYQNTEEVGTGLNDASIVGPRVGFKEMTHVAFFDEVVCPYL